MIDLSTRYLGLTLPSPLVCSSSPLCQDLDALRRMEEAGAGAVVLHSLFEEQIARDGANATGLLEGLGAGGASSLDMDDYNLGPEGYLEHLREARSLLKVPVIASLNGHTRGGWVRYARQLQEAGASAIELNVYEVPGDPERTSNEVEDGVVSLVRDVCREVTVPVAVKLGPFYTALASFARRLAHAGARGLVLFNRFYQPDFDLERQEVVPTLWLSVAEELRLRLHAVAMLAGRVEADFAVTGGVHTAQDVLKAIHAGASVAMMTSALLRHGVNYLAEVRAGVIDWLEGRGRTSLAGLCGAMSFRSMASPDSFERENYLKVLRAHALFPPRP